MIPATGIVRLARFDAGGLALFDASPTGLLNALAPWVAFSVVGFVLMLLGGAADEALRDLLGTLVWLLTPVVLSHALAVWWGRRVEWLRYAVAFTWCQWVMPPAFLAAFVAGRTLTAAGLSDIMADRTAGLAVLAYALALQGFIAHRALAISRGRSAALVAIINVGTGALVLAPTLLRALLEQPA